jgi:hypothetical protein
MASKRRVARLQVAKVQLSVHPRRRAAAQLEALKLGAQGDIMSIQRCKMRQCRKVARARAQPSDH